MGTLTLQELLSTDYRNFLAVEQIRYLGEIKKAIEKLRGVGVPSPEEAEVILVDAVIARLRVEYPMSETWGPAKTPTESCNELKARYIVHRTSANRELLVAVYIFFPTSQDELEPWTSISVGPTFQFDSIDDNIREDTAYIEATANRDCDRGMVVSILGFLRTSHLFRYLGFLETRIQNGSISTAPILDDEPADDHDDDLADAGSESSSS